ncbi:MAG: AAA family ATPase [Planctomyces sp.]
MVDLSFIRTDTAADDRYVRRLQGSMNSLKRAQAYLRKTPGAVSGESGHNTTYWVACKLVHGFHLSDSDAMRLMAVWNSKCEPPWSDSELKHKIADARATGTAADADQLLPPSPAAAAPPPPSSRQAPPAAPVVPPLTYRDAWAAIAHPEPMAEVVVEGLLRRGETANIIASTKVGKSWLGLQLLLAVSTGGDWLGLRCAKGPCLLIDNELHDWNIQNRLHSSAVAAGITTPGDSLQYVRLRGDWLSLPDLTSRLVRDWQPGQLQLIVMDAKYRFFGGDLDENSNAAQTQFHNELDRLATALDCAIVVVHHSTKGSQAEKSVTDMGRGGGAQAGAVDTHIVIRPHQLPELAVLEAAVRSFRPLQPQTIRFDFPLWSGVSGVAPRLTKPSKADVAAQELRDALTTDWQTLNKLAMTLGCGVNTDKFRSAVKAVVQDGTAERNDEFRPPRSTGSCVALRLTGSPDSDFVELDAALPPAAAPETPPPSPARKRKPKAATAEE